VLTDAGSTPAASTNPIPLIETGGIDIDRISRQTLPNSTGQT